MHAKFTYNYRSVYRFYFCNRHDKYKEFITRKRIAIAINEEINYLFNLAKEKDWISFLEGDPEKFEEVILPITYDYFDVYRANTHLISLLDITLTRNVIRFYNNTKSLLEDIKIHNDLITQYRNLNTIPNSQDLHTLTNQAHKMSYIWQQCIDIRKYIYDMYKNIENLRKNINTDIDKIKNNKFLYFIN